MIIYKQIIQKIHVLLSSRLDKVLSIIFYEFSRSHIKNLICNGKVYINEKIELLPNRKVYGGELVSLYIEKKKIIEPKYIKLNIVYEDNDIIVINKQKNLIVHPPNNNYNKITLINALYYYYPPIKNIPRFGIVHRLDKNTTGLMLIAKNTNMQLQLTQLFKKKSILREYDAIALGSLHSSKTIDKPIARHPVKRTTRIVHANGRNAITHYRIIKNFCNYTWLKVQLETGRTHQIRVHLSYIKHPLLGDTTYGYHINKCIKNCSIDNIVSDFNRQALHSSKLEFIHPEKKNYIKLEIPLPEDMQKIIDQLIIN